MILDILITIVLVIIVLYPSLLKHMNTKIGQIILLISIYFISLQNLFLGFISAFIYIFYVNKKVENFSPKFKSKHSLLPLDESIRAKDSNRISVDRNSTAPPREELSGHIPTTFANNSIGNYTQV
jgi:hypothetical protein